MEEAKGKWKIADLGKLLLNSLQAVLKGEFLLRLNIGRYFIHILYTFLLFALIIWISLMIDGTLTKVEKNKATLEELEITCNQKTYEMVSLCRRSTVEQSLIRMGSELRDREKPVTELKK